MGSVSSAHCSNETDDIWWTNGQQEDESSMEHRPARPVHPRKNQEALDEFKFDMERKHEKRRAILDAKKKQFDGLREEVARLKTEKDKLKADVDGEVLEELRRLKEENDRLQSSTMVDNDLIRENERLKGYLKDKIDELQKMATLLDKNRELKINIAEMQDELQKLNGVVVEFEKEREEYKAHVVALKDVVSVSKKMLLIRESQLKELKQKVESIEQSLSAKEMNVLSQDLRQEYERQLQSIRNLRALYEERQRSDYKEKEELKKSLEESKKLLEDEQKKFREAEQRITELEEQNSKNYDEIKSLESNLGLSKAESRQYQAELTVINQLFSEILLGFNNSQDMNLDTLIKNLEEHHELLQNIVVNEASPESSSALPKVLLDLVNEVTAQEQKAKLEDAAAVAAMKLETIVEESESQTNTADQINSAEEIVQLLPKVWRVLIELLSHQRVPITSSNVVEPSKENPCYKTVQTPKGPSLVLSVSQTFIRLKDLILEKKSLEKETGHLKQLNTHLENRLQDQEKRLQTVSSELNDTWHVVGKLQKQHQVLHTQEKILRYELAQKRKLLNTLKEELEYSREKWQQAREKNSKTEMQWKQLRIEFASRRNTVASDEFSNSQESGYSDERCSSSSGEDEPGYETDVSEGAYKTNEAAVPVQNSTDDVRETSCRFVSSIIEEAIEAIVKQESAKSANRDGSDQNHSVTVQDEELAGPSNVTISAEQNASTHKEERLKRLEQLCGDLVQQVTNTTAKSTFISNKLDRLHEAYGGEEGSSSSQDSTNTVDITDSNENSGDKKG